MEFQLYRTVIGIGSIGLTALILELMRRRRLKEELWLPWLAASLAPLVISVWITPWAIVARWLGFKYEPALLLTAGLLISFGLILHLTIVISTLLRQNLRLAQDIAHLALRLDRLTRLPSGSTLPSRRGGT
jgi:hypothetical protein